jgi:ankyrin repeat protein
MSEARAERDIAIHAGFVAGDADALADSLGDRRWFDAELPETFGGGHALVYAIYWSPPAFVASMIEAGADVNFAADDGFPALFAALSRDAPPRHDVLAVLLTHGADVDARGINDWTPLHHAVNQRDAVAVRMLLAAGADPRLRTRIDQYATALDDARAIGFGEAVELLEAAGGPSGIRTETRDER